MPRTRSAPLPLPPVPAPAVQPHERLRALRRKHGLSQSQLAALAGIRKATLVAIERDETEVPNEATLRKLAAVFGMSLEELRRETGMVGPLYIPSMEALVPATTMRRYSPRAERIAELVDALPAKEQRLIETLCRYFCAWRDARPPWHRPEE